jgi:Ca2+-binding EF-hand superfamily protein
MKTNIKLALLTAFVIGLAGVSARAQSDEPSDPGNLPPGPPHVRFGQVLSDVIQKYDANHDGQLDQSEMAALQKDIADGKIQPPGPPRQRGPRGAGGPPAHFPKEIVDKYDINHDGQLDETERAALHQDIQDGKLPPPRFGARLRGPGGPWSAERPTAEQVLDKFDTDKDGKLDAAELAAFLNAAPPRLEHVPGLPPPAAPPAQE